MRKWRPLMGVLLILCAVASFILWEWKGRETLMMEPVLVAGTYIEAGEKVDSSLFKIISVPRENKVSEALTERDLAGIDGKTAQRAFYVNQQITPDLFYTADAMLPEGKSIFQIKAEWIDNRSSSLRKGDLIDIYGADAVTYLGRYPIAFVKDQYEQEVETPEGGKKNVPLERTAATSQISHVEIIAGLPDYGKLREYLLTGDSEGLLLIQVEGGEPVDPKTANQLHEPQEQVRESTKETGKDSER